MKVSKYEEFTKSHGLSPVDKILRDDYNILIAEGFSRGDADEPTPHYKSMYAYNRGEEVFLGEFFTTPILVSDKHKRKDECIRRAVEMLTTFKETGCLK